MRRLTVFSSISLDGCFTDESGNMDFAHNAQPDPEWDTFVAGNASGNATLVFGRLTYEMMARFWTSTVAAERVPVVAGRMNALQKVVFSKTLAQVSWQNTTLLSGEPASEIRRLKHEPGHDMVILGSGSLVSQLTAHRLIDEYQIVVVPVVLGAGRTLFDGLAQRVPLRLTNTRAFPNGNVVLTYEPSGG